ncbi:MAG: hypothetical protein OXG85_01300 [Chloroflexi bacterium]|nr:hypothetical protein [Chloroflexota bacterium]
MNFSIERDVPFNGLENTSIKEAWFIQYRPAIRTIITSGNQDIFLCACTLCVPWMDGCYAIDNFGYDTFRHNPTSLSREYGAKDIVKFIFFNNEGGTPSEKHVKLLATFYNSLKHGGFLRPGQKVAGLPILITNIALVNELGQISMNQWVERATNRIDQLLVDATFEEKAKQ